MVRAAHVMLVLSVTLTLVGSSPLPAARQLAAPPAGASDQGIPGYSCYRTVEETYAAAEALAAQYPALATWIDIGDSWRKSQGVGGYDLRVLKLTNTAIHGAKPRLFIVAAVHGREYAPPELATRFGEYLLSNYGRDADATWILDHHEVHLLLLANPDGRKEAETGLDWSKNVDDDDGCADPGAWGTDLNRNFPFQWACCEGSSDSPCDNKYHGPAAGSEPETQAIQDYLQSLFPDQRGPNLSDPASGDASGIYMDIHSFGRQVMWPWGFTTTAAPNSSALRTLGRKLAYFNGYTPQALHELYPSDGSSVDHSYGTLGVASIALEVGRAFFEPCSYFSGTLWSANLPALIYAAKVVRTPYTTPAGPDALNLTLNRTSVPAGRLVTLSATINDTRYSNSNGSEASQNIAAAEYYVDVPLWAGGTPYAMAASDGRFSRSVEGVTAAIDTTGWSPGKHILFVRGKDANDNWGAFSAIFLTVTSASDTVWLSLTSNATLPAIGSVNDEDIVALSLASGFYSWVLDASDVGITTDIDAFDVLSNGHILMSFDATTAVTGVGTVTDADVVEFTPTSLGTTTAGTFTWKFDGSDVGLASSSEGVDALYMMDDGTMLVSIRNSFSVTGVAGQDEDLIRFSAVSWGSTTAGTWSWYFDGSDVGLSNNSNEDVDALWVDQSVGPNPDVYLCTIGNFSVTGVSGANEDVFVFHPTALGSTTTGTFGPGLYLDGSLFGLSAYDVDAFDVQR